MNPDLQQGKRARFQSISAKLNFILLLSIVTAFLFAGTALSNWLAGRLEDRGVAELKRTNHLLLDMIEAYSSALEKSAEMLGENFATGMANHLNVDSQRMVMTGSNPLPALKAGDAVLNNQTDMVDRFTKATGGVATIFVRHGENFYRITTSLRNAKGERVIGTPLDEKHPAHQLLLAGKVYTGPATLFGRNYMTHYSPIVDAAGKTIAAAFIGLDFTDGLQGLKAKIRALKIGDTGYSFVVDAVKEPGLAIIHPSAEGKSLIDVKDQNGTPITRRLIELKSGELRYWWQNTELGETMPREKITVVDTFGKWGWLVGSGTYVDELSREAVAARWQMAVIGLAILGILAFALFWATSRWVTKPMTAALEITRKVADGDLTQHITTTSKDEVGQLLVSLDQMSSHLRDMVSEIDSGIRHLADNAHELAQASNTVASSSGEQSQAATTMAATVEEMTTSIKQVAAHADSCREMASHSGSVSSHGIAVIHKAIEGMTQIAQTVSQSSDAVSHLGDESKAISHIVNVIREIADQTNLLALNAAIEAARAGEAGRGFAVVADEVRKLAERTTQSTQEITVMVDRIQQGAINAVESMHQGEGQVSQGVVLANEAGTQISEIKSGADNVSLAVVGIADALREQNAANQEIARNVERIAEQAESNHLQAKRTADTALGMEALAAQLRASITRFRT